VLNNLPKDPPLFQNSGGYAESPPVVVPRDVYLREALCLSKVGAPVLRRSVPPRATFSTCCFGKLCSLRSLAPLWESS
jgi:hypothetical protein